MSSFLECWEEISFYMKKLTFLSWMRGFFPIVANCLNSLSCLSDYFFILPAIFYSYCEVPIFFYIADIVSRCAKSYPQWFAFSFVRKKKRIQTNREINIHLKQKKKKNKPTQKKKQKQFQYFLYFVRFMFRLIFKGKHKTRKKIKDKR